MRLIVLEREDQEPSLTTTEPTRKPSQRSRSAGRRGARSKSATTSTGLRSSVHLAPRCPDQGVAQERGTRGDTNRRAKQAFAPRPVAACGRDTHTEVAFLGARVAPGRPGGARDGAVRESFQARARSEQRLVPREARALVGPPAPAPSVRVDHLGRLSPLLGQLHLLPHRTEHSLDPDGRSDDAARLGNGRAPRQCEQRHHGPRHDLIAVDLCDGGQVEACRHADNRMRAKLRRLLDFWRVAGRPAPRNGKGQGTG